MSASEMASSAAAGSGSSAAWSARATRRPAARAVRGVGRRRPARAGPRQRPLELLDDAGELVPVDALRREQLLEAVRALAALRGVVAFVCLGRVARRAGAEQEPEVQVRVRRRPGVRQPARRERVARRRRPRLRAQPRKRIVRRRPGRRVRARVGRRRRRAPRPRKGRSAAGAPCLPARGPGAASRVRARRKVDRLIVAARRPRVRVGAQPRERTPGRRGAGGGRRAMGDGGDASVVASVGGATADGGATMGDAIIDVGASIAGGPAPAADSRSTWAPRARASARRRASVAARRIRRSRRWPRGRAQPAAPRRASRRRRTGPRVRGAVAARERSAVRALPPARNGPPRARRWPADRRRPAAPAASSRTRRLQASKTRRRRTRRARATAAAAAEAVASSVCSWCGAERCKRVAVLAPGAIAHFKLHVSYQLHTVGLPKAMKCRSQQLRQNPRVFDVCGGGKASFLLLLR